MFKTVTAKGEDTRERIYGAALKLFRGRGFDATTMRDIAAAADMSLGAAYHYFPSKDAIVLAYYDRVSKEHTRRVAAEATNDKPLAARLAIALHSKIEILRNDRPLMGALLRYAGDPKHPLSFFGATLRQHRLEGMAAFSLALGDEHLPDDMARIAPVALWALHMGLLLFFLHDSSSGARRTTALATGAIGLIVATFKLARLPLLRSIRKRIVALLDEAKLLPDLEDIEQAKLASV
jgi:AcrR family transcriptional regulator